MEWVNGVHPGKPFDGDDAEHMQWIYSEIGNDASQFVGPLVLNLLIKCIDPRTYCAIMRILAHLYYVLCTNILCFFLFRCDGEIDVELKHVRDAVAKKGQALHEEQDMVKKVALATLDILSVGASRSGLSSRATAAASHGLALTTVASSSPRSAAPAPSPSNCRQRQRGRPSALRSPNRPPRQ
ncbi:hypothetical protein ZEAMMB73_Zm00001d038899, partial [Zea mays]